MTWAHYYTLLAASYAAYLLGRKHQQGQSGFKNTLACLVAGAGWPAMVVWGMVISHRSKESA